MMEHLADLMVEVADTLEFVGCGHRHCDGPTLDPVDMVTCARCATLAKVRVLIGQPPRAEGELTCAERLRWADEVAVARATGRAVRTFEEVFGADRA